MFTIERVRSASSLQPPERVSYAIQDSVHKTGCPDPTEPVSQTDRFVYNDLGGSLRQPKLVNAEPQNVAFYHGDPAHPPVLDRLSELGIEGVDLADDRGSQFLGAVEDPRLRPRQTGDATDDEGNGRSALQL